MNPLAGIFDESWVLYKAHWRHFASIALLIYALVAAIGILLILTLGWLGALLGALVGIAGTFWLQGTLIEAVRDVRDGVADHSVTETFNRVFPRLNRIVLAGIVLGLAIGAGFLLLVVPGLVLLTLWVFVIPAVVLEDRDVGSSFGRSRELVRGNGWNVFGVIVLTFLLWIAVSIALRLVLSPLEDWIAGLIQQIVGYTLVGPFIAVVWTLSYYRLRGLEETAAEPGPAV